MKSFGMTATFLNSQLQLAKLAVTAVVGAVKPFVDEFMRAQDESKKLANIMQVFGDYSETALKSFEDGRISWKKPQQ